MNSPLGNFYSLEQELHDTRDALERAQSFASSALSILERAGTIDGQRTLTLSAFNAIYQRLLYITLLSSQEDSK